QLLEIVNELRSRGVSIVYITHRLVEVQAIADRVVVLRDGKNAGTLTSSEITHDAMIRLMVGRDLAQAYHASSSSPAARYRAWLSRNSESSFEFKDLRSRRYPEHALSFTARGGEILGLAGLVGAGRSELAQAIFGIDPLSGSISSGGK